MNDEGAGASRTTDPAQGSSSATDVSLREHLAARMDYLDRLTTAELAALRRETNTAGVNADKAIEVAAHEASERLAAHNGLIEQMRQQANTFATRESVDDYKPASDWRMRRVESNLSKLYGGLAVVAFVGIANLVKVWSG